MRSLAATSAGSVSRRQRTFNGTKSPVSALTSLLEKMPSPSPLSAHLRKSPEGFNLFENRCPKCRIRLAAFGDKPLRVDHELGGSFHI
jgi:hypothetical protein